MSYIIFEFLSIGWMFGSLYIFQFFKLNKKLHPINIFILWAILIFIFLTISTSLKNKEKLEYNQKKIHKLYVDSILTSNRCKE